RTGLPECPDGDAARCRNRRGRRRRGLRPRRPRLRLDPATGRAHGARSNDGRRRSLRAGAGAGRDRAGGRDRGDGARQGRRGLSGNPQDAGLMDDAAFYDTLRQALWIATVISTPLLAVALATGLVVGLFQALTSIQEMTLTFV